MNFRSLDASGDWTWGNGRQNYAQGQAAIAFSIQTRLNSFLNDCFFDAEAGIDWFNLLGSKNISALIFSIRSIIIATPGVSSITDLSSDLDVNRKLSLKYAVTTVYGLSITNSIVFPITPFAGIDKFVADVPFDGTTTIADIDVSSRILDAQDAIWMVYDESDNFSMVVGAAQPISTTTVRITIVPAPAAGFFRLVGIA